MSIAILAALSAGTAWSHPVSLPASGELACDRMDARPCVFVSPGDAATVRLPLDWPLRRLKLVTETGPAAWSRQRAAVRWLSIVYLPEEPSYPETPLFNVAVLRYCDWVSQSVASADPRGIEVAASPGYVAVAIPASEPPYPEESRDAEIFAALRPGLEEISLIVGFDAYSPRARGSGNGAPSGVNCRDIELMQ